MNKTMDEKKEIKHRFLDLHLKLTLYDIHILYFSPMEGFNFQQIMALLKAAYSDDDVWLAENSTTMYVNRLPVGGHVPDDHCPTVDEYVWLGTAYAKKILVEAMKQELIPSNFLLDPDEFMKWIVEVGFGD